MCSAAQLIGVRFLKPVKVKIGRNRKCYENVYQRQDGKEAVVTGGSRGIGLEIVNNLLKCGYNVVIGSSSSEESRLTLKQMLLKKYPDCNVEVWHLDLASMKSVKAFAEHYLSTKLSCHLLINNAGIMFVKNNKLLMATRSILLSCIHFVGSYDVKNFQNQKYYSKYKAYIDSKLAQVIFTYTLQNYLDKENLNVKVNCVHPGVVDTDLMNSVLLIPRLGSLFFKSAEEGAHTATYAALSTDMEGTGGKYLEECSTVTSSKVSEDKQLQKELWELTWKVLHPWMSDNGYYFMNTSALTVR
ncbi:short-chain dehydrogenase TIC 32, chloroplastic [Caerostris extrusa]|uniref:Short-chain dehydrogenase TIC 32, chloroplastic n=1 Tax=Caerostris extrusa TaxID=172846 RepID=A0AAV4XWJ4_CAEEX|nr:short-chain dehydrogenase TIC 32, chloroplastic [Caerostris extrusa]